jgi:hypothetical protein
MANLASTEADADRPADPAAEAGPFVLNLCSSTTPMALAQTELPELKRFTFFVSRRFEEGRERFRLHMGFFATQAEAEEWLSLVREIYPGAWAGEAPGKKLRARATEAAAAQARHAVGPQPSAAPAARPTKPPAPAPAARAPSAPSGLQAAPGPVPKLVPTLHPPAPAAAPVIAQRAATAPSGKAVPESAGKRSPPMASSPRPAQAPRPAPAAQARPAPTLQSPQTRNAVPMPAGGQRPTAKAAPAGPATPPAAARPAAAKPTPAAVKPAPQTPRSHEPAKKPVFANSNVKEVLAALDSTSDATGETRLMPAASMAHAMPADDASLTDTQVLKFLESRRDESGAARVDPAAESGISLLKPDDTGTRRALKVAVSHDDPVSFAVQLQWSVQPVELDKVPPLAIFSAYTLYSVEGSREGRKWYGLRLGFFNDAISAKQVAYYVRAEFASVAVVPVSPQERERATEDNVRFAGVGAPKKRREREDNEFKLIDSDTPPAEEAPRAVAPAAAAPNAVAPQPATAARSARKASGKVGARERRTPQTLEETLEILGANELAIDNGSRDSVSDTGVRHLRVEVQKNTPFSRLLERLSERVKKV